MPIYVVKEILPGVKLNIPIDGGSSEGLKIKPKSQLSREVDKVEKLFNFLMSDMKDCDPDAQPAQIPVPKSFKDLYQARAGIQAGMETFGSRHPAVAQFYDEFKAFDALEKAVFGGKSVNEHLLDEYLQMYPILLSANRFPYELPPHTMHRVLWYREGVTKAEKAAFLAWELAPHNIGAGDVFTFTNPLIRRSVPQYSHDHVIMRFRKSLVADFYGDW